VEAKEQNVIIGVYKCPVNGETILREYGFLDDVPPEVIDCEFHPDQKNHCALLINIEARERSKNQSSGVETEI